MNCRCKLTTVSVCHVRAITRISGNSVPFSCIDSFAVNEIKWQCAFTEHTTQKSITKSESMLIHLILNAEILI